MQSTAISFVLGLLLTSCSPMSVEECEAILPAPPGAYDVCFSTAQAEPCYSDDFTYGEVELDDGELGWCCRAVSRGCTPSTD